jgi:hypothetical protein
MSTDHSQHWLGWSGRWESNPRLKLGKLGYYHYTTPAYRPFYAPELVARDPMQS